MSVMRGGDSWKPGEGNVKERGHKQIPEAVNGEARGRPGTRSRGERDEHGCVAGRFPHSPPVLDLSDSYHCLNMQGALTN